MHREPRLCMRHNNIIPVACRIIMLISSALNYLFITIIEAGKTNLCLREVPQSSSASHSKKRACAPRKPHDGTG